MIDAAGAERVSLMIVALRTAGIKEEAEMFECVYWAWLRMTEAYVCAHPYVANPEPGMTPVSALHVVDVTFEHWSDLVPGSPKLNDAAVLEEAAADDAWHEAEDRRMRREEEGV